MSERTTALTVASHRRFVLSTVVTALRDAFGATYDRDPQLVNLKVTTQYPLEAIDYPCIVVEYDNQVVENAGVGHEEWFNDSKNILRKWHHSRFEGTMNFEIMGLTPVDRDIMADALTEVIRFGRLDEFLLPFFSTLYGLPTDPVALLFNQIMFNSDQVHSSGNTASLAPWSPEDLMVYQTSLTSQVHGGYYNVNPQDTYGYVTRAILLPYNPNEQPVVIDLTADWNNPLQYLDEDTVKGKGVVGGSSTFYYAKQNWSQARIRNTVISSRNATARIQKTFANTQTATAHIA